KVASKMEKMSKYLKVFGARPVLAFGPEGTVLKAQPEGLGTRVIQKGFSVLKGPFVGVQMNRPFRTENRVGHLPSQPVGLGFKNRPFRTEDQKPAVSFKTLILAVILLLLLVPSPAY